ncbi:MAG: 16S rRNA (cytidine(1402)-2'-O)-methyltransferase [Acidobacteria bacterium]|nr:16S rRNA (cytidine(1402)-2'-O)-methyltransferase [Acidobacteriota bacterium]
MPGTLFVVATPIGNLEDLSPRAARILRDVDRIACEDTRHTRKLLEHLGISRPMISYHEHNERERTEMLLEALRRGEKIALLSDAGTPLISDPGYRLVECAVASGIAVVPIPGPSAVIAALSASGLGTDTFYFGGYFFAKRTQRRKQLEEVKGLAATLVFFEAPHRMLETLEDIEAVLGQRKVVLARELTKMHEELLRGSAAELKALLEARPAIKGEITVLIGKAGVRAAQQERPVPELVAACQAQGMSRMDAIKKVAKDLGLPKRDVYRAVENR